MNTVGKDHWTDVVTQQPEKAKTGARLFTFLEAKINSKIPCTRLFQSLFKKFLEL